MGWISIAGKVAKVAVGVLAGLISNDDINESSYDLALAKFKYNNDGTITVENTSGAPVSMNRDFENPINASIFWTSVPDSIGGITSQLSFINSQESQDVSREMKTYSDGYIKIATTSTPAISADSAENQQIINYAAPSIASSSTQIGNLGTLTANDDRFTFQALEQYIPGLVAAALSAENAEGIKIESIDAPVVGRGEIDFLYPPGFNFTKPISNITMSLTLTSSAFEILQRAAA